MSELLESAGAGTAAGGLVTWLISYLKNKDIKEDISKRVHKDTYNTDQTALKDRMDLISGQHGLICNLRTENLQKQLEDFKILQTKMDEKIDKLLDRREHTRE